MPCLVLTWCFDRKSYHVQNKMRVLCSGRRCMLNLLGEIIPQLNDGSNMTTFTFMKCQGVWVKVKVQGQRWHWKQALLGWKLWQLIHFHCYFHFHIQLRLQRKLRKEKYRSTGTEMDWGSCASRWKLWHFEHLRFWPDMAQVVGKQIYGTYFFG